MSSCFWEMCKNSSGNVSCDAAMLSFVKKYQNSIPFSFAFFTRGWSSARCAGSFLRRMKLTSHGLFIEVNPCIRQSPCKKQESRLSLKVSLSHSGQRESLISLMLSKSFIADKLRNRNVRSPGSAGSAAAEVTAAESSESAAEPAAVPVSAEPASESSAVHDEGARTAAESAVAVFSVFAEKEENDDGYDDDEGPGCACRFAFLRLHGSLHVERDAFLFCDD